MQAIPRAIEAGVVIDIDGDRDLDLVLSLSRTLRFAMANGVGRAANA